MLGYRRVDEGPGAVKDLLRFTQSVLRRQPRVADAALALVLAIAALVAAATFVDDIRTADPSYDPPGWLAIVLVQLGITFPLARRRRFPLWVVVIVPLVSRRPERRQGSGPVASPCLAATLAIYSAARHGEGPFRSPCWPSMASRSSPSSP